MVKRHSDSQSAAQDPTSARGFSRRAFLKLGAVGAAGARRCRLGGLCSVWLRRRSGRRGERHGGLGRGCGRRDQLERGCDQAHRCYAHLVVHDST